VRQDRARAAGQHGRYGAEGHECRLLLGLVEKAPVYIFRFLDQA